MYNKQLADKYGEERVLVLESSIVSSTDVVEDYLDNIKYFGRFKLRYDVEEDLNYRQIIPYVVVKCKEKFLITRRIKGDSRLVGMTSIGMGGHINPVDRFMAEGKGTMTIDVIKSCVIREIKEETTAEDINDIRICSAFIDDSSDVSKVHACLLCIVNLDEEVNIRELYTLEGMWVEEKEITREIFDSFENWSKIAYKKVFGKEAPKIKRRRRKSAQI